MRRFVKTEESDFYCTKCGQFTYSIRRLKGQEREPGHLKRLWCPFCNEEHNCVEVRSSAYGYTKKDFDLEFAMGNFDKDGNRKRTFKENRQLYEKIKKIRRGEINE